MYLSGIDGAGLDVSGGAGGAGFGGSGAGTGAGVGTGAGTGAGADRSAAKTGVARPRESRKDQTGKPSPASAISTRTGLSPGLARFSAA